MASHLIMRLDHAHHVMGSGGGCRMDEAVFRPLMTQCARISALPHEYVDGVENTHNPDGEGIAQSDDKKMSTGSYMHIKALCNQKRLKEALDIVLGTYQQGLPLEPDSIAELLLLCTSMGALAEGKQLHLLVRNKAVRSNAYLQNNLLNMYTKCGSLAEGQQVFEEMPSRDVVSWNAMIAGYAKSGNNSEAIKLFWRMQQENVEPNKNTFVCVLRACAPPACIEDGVHIHACVVGCALESNVFVGSALVEMYAKFGSLRDARRVFEDMTVKDVVSWTSMIAGYSESGHGEEALHLFQQMLQEGVYPDKVIFFSVLRACASPAALKHGLKVHLHIIDAGFELDVYVGSALVDMYAKCGNLHLACQVFEQLPIKDVVSWTALISGYEQQGESKEALKIFGEMVNANVKPNEVTFVSAINACTALVALNLGVSVHSDIVDFGYESNLYVASALIDMYAKCGSEEGARAVFHRLLNRDAVTWNAMIDGLAQHGNPKAALQYFEQMKQDGVKVNSMTFVGVLAACNHAGLVDEGLCYFDSMQRDHRITPSAEHYACMVDILSRAGHLEAANDFLKKLPSESSMSVLTALLSACRVHGNVDVAKSAVESLIKLEPQKESAYVLLSNVYAVTEGKEQALIGTNSSP
eukprot:c23471_g2_i1 orf=1133-3049(-)